MNTDVEFIDQLSAGAQTQVSLSLTLLLYSSAFQDFSVLRTNRVETQRSRGAERERVPCERWRRLLESAFAMPDIGKVSRASGAKG